MRILILVLSLMFSGCSSGLQTITEEQIDRTYAGEISVGEPIQTEKGIELNLAFSEGGWIQHSGICFRSAEAEVDERIIRLKVFTSVCTGDTIRPKLVLDKELEGIYDLVFEDPDGKTHPLTTIEIP